MDADVPCRIIAGVQRPVDRQTIYWVSINAPGNISLEYALTYCNFASTHNAHIQEDSRLSSRQPNHKMWGRRSVGAARPSRCHKVCFTIHRPAHFYTNDSYMRPTYDYIAFCPGLACLLYGLAGYLLRNCRTFSGDVDRLIVAAPHCSIIKPRSSL